MRKKLKRKRLARVSASKRAEHLERIKEIKRSWEERFCKAYEKHCISIIDIYNRRKSKIVVRKGPMDNRSLH